MGINAPSLVVANVAHKRHHPKVNSFNYNVYYLCFALNAVDTLKRSILSLRGFNLFAHKQTDHGDGATKNETWARSVLNEWKLSDVTDGKIILLTMPRILGYAFNPVSFWFCLDKDNNIRAVISEVCNTFNEKHCYISFHDNKNIITKDDVMSSRKVFHVSPFMNVEGSYEYRFICDDTRIAVWINHITESGLMLETSLIGSHIAYNTKNLLMCFVRYPLVTFKVTSLIYYQAWKLFRKGIKYNPKPIPPSTFISR